MSFDAPIHFVRKSAGIERSGTWPIVISRERPRATLGVATLVGYSRGELLVRQSYLSPHNIFVSQRSSSIYPLSSIAGQSCMRHTLVVNSCSSVELRISLSAHPSRLDRRRCASHPPGPVSCLLRRGCRVALSGLSAGATGARFSVFPSACLLSVNNCDSWQSYFHTVHLYNGENNAL